MERVSQSMMSQMFMKDMYGGLNRLMDVEQQLSSGQLYNRPSDNPSEVVRGMTLESTLAANEQYMDNLDDAVTWLANTETALGQITDCISSIRENAVYACDGALSDVDREAIAREIEALRDEIVQSANYNVEGSYLLAGYDTTRAPFAVADDGTVEYGGDLGNISFQIEQNTMGQISLNGRDVFPVDFERYSMESIEVPLDFRWEGGSETLRFKVGDRQADVTFPEQWTDDDMKSGASQGDHDRFRSPSDQVEGYSLTEIADMINRDTTEGGAGKLVRAEVRTDTVSGTQTLTIQSLSGEPLQVTSFPATDTSERGQWAAMGAADPTSAVWTDSENTKIAKGGTVTVKFSGGESHSIQVAAGTMTVADLAAQLSGLPGLWAAARGNGIALVAENETEPFTVSTSTDLDIFVEPPFNSQPVQDSGDFSHTGLASLLGFQTAVTSTEVPLNGADSGVIGDTDSQSLAIQFVAGDNRTQLQISGEGDLTLEEFAERLRNQAGDWLEVIVENDEAATGYPFVDEGGNVTYASADGESASQRLILRTYDGASLNIYDVGDSGYARNLGIQTAVKAEKPSGDVADLFPDVSSNRPARIGVEVGGETLEVRLFYEDVAADDGTVDMAAVGREIRDQVGSDRITVDFGEDGDFALYSPMGEPVRVVDLPYADTTMEGRSSGVAAALGLQSGITGAGVASTATAVTAGTFTIATTGRSVDIAVSGGDTLADVARKIGEQAGGWMDVSLSEDSSGMQQLALSPRDGSAVSVFDLTGTAATTFKINTDVRAGGSWAAGDALEITVDGYTHTLDLTGVADVDELAELVNARFPGMDVQAQAIDDDGDGTNDGLTFYSPRGKSVAVVQTKKDALDPSLLTFSNSGETENRGGSGPNGQNTVVRTGTDVHESDFFGVLEDLASAVRHGDTEGISNSLLPEIDKAMDDVLQARSFEGALQVRYESARRRLSNDKISMTDLYSRVMDVDMAEAAMEFQSAQVAYQATLAAMSKVVQQTLVDYLT